jgi:hypothetical protein
MTPHIQKTNVVCEIDTDTTIVDDLDNAEIDAINKEPNKLWELHGGELRRSGRGGSTESVVDHYVACVINSVASALKLPLSIEPQTDIDNIKSDLWIISEENGIIKRRLIGCAEDKLPYQRYGNPFALDHNSFYVQIHSQMMKIREYYGTTPVFAIGSTGREWRIFKLSEDSLSDVVDSQSFAFPNAAPPKYEKFSPLTSFMGALVNPIEYGDTDMDVDSNSVLEDFEEAEDDIDVVTPKLLATKIYKWNDPATLRCIGSTLKQMFNSGIKRVNIDSLGSRVMWHLVKVNELRKWGFARSPFESLQRNVMINKRTTNVYVVCILGSGSDGKVLLVANKRGQTAAMKLAKLKFEGILF